MRYAKINTSKGTQKQLENNRSIFKEDSYTQVDFHVNGIQYRFSMDNYGTSREIIRL